MLVRLSVCSRPHFDDLSRSAQLLHSTDPATEKFQTQVPSNQISQTEMECLDSSIRIWPHSKWIRHPFSHRREPDRKYLVQWRWNRAGKRGSGSQYLRSFRHDIAQIFTDSKTD